MTPIRFALLLISILFIVQPASSVTSPLLFTYGRHFPHAGSAVLFTYSEQFKKLQNRIQYKWNYYQQYATAKHPFNRDALIAYANGTNFATCMDANDHLLLDFNHTGEIDTSIPENVGAFHEHNGKGVDGVTRGNPFTNFWFDDNYLARFMSLAFGFEAPYGLSEYNNFTRWQILGGNQANWKPYDSDYFDTLALDGLYYLTHGCGQEKAFDLWMRMVKKSGATYVQETQQYDYPYITENYHMGLFMILTSNLMSIYGTQLPDIMQHYVALRSHILSNQQTDKRPKGGRLGWTSSITDKNSLMNTESAAVNVLALGANVILALEPADISFPSCPSCNFFVRPYHAISAVTGVSHAGYMAISPQLSYDDIAMDLLKTNCTSDSTCVVQYLVRVPDATTNQSIANMLLFDTITQRALVNTTITSDMLLNGNRWSIVQVALPVITTYKPSWQFQFYWYGHVNTDLAAIRVTTAWNA